jgi:hypothetical protein
MILSDRRQRRVGRNTPPPRCRGDRAGGAGPPSHLSCPLFAPDGQRPARRRAHKSAPHGGIECRQGYGHSGALIGSLTWSFVTDEATRRRVGPAPVTALHCHRPETFRSASGMPCPARVEPACASSAPRRSVAHWINSSAVANSVSGMVRPRAFAVLRLMASSIFVSCCTGRTAGFSPFRMRST